jgi:hypothetical protein
VSYPGFAGAALAYPGTRWPGVARLVSEPDEDWSARLVSTMPSTWAGRLLARWRKRHPVDRRGANLAHLHACKGINLAHRAGVRADANDDEIRAEADRSARDAERRVRHVTAMARAGLRDVHVWWRDVEERGRLALAGAWLELREWLGGLGLADQAEKLIRTTGGAIAPAVARVCCAKWWRRVLRRMHARGVEAVARSIGLVSKQAGCYVSHDSLKRRRGQLARNAAVLEGVHAVNEHGQDYTLAELAAKGTANREIRRHELMTRIAGFELIARECDHLAYFVTVTCPSRMHAQRLDRNGLAQANPKFDGTLPDAAQAHLSKQWSKARAAADRAGLAWYGFRIAEPNHDGTPHWHALLFFPKRTTSERLAYRVMVRILRRYFLHQVDGAEQGARRHRVKVERIDWTRGSAAGYVAKYVAKNIDGHRVEKDLFGNDAITSAQRVEAWAATWRVRQFQQIGGAPVGVWRELRRLHPDQGQAAPAIELALQAVNIASEAPDHHSELMQRYTAATGWQTYTELQGGTRVRRRALRVGLLTRPTAEVGRYGDTLAPRVVGVQTTDVHRHHVPGFGIVAPRTFTTVRQVLVESERARWIVVPKVAIEAARREAMRPWTRVNNCTDPRAQDANPYVKAAAQQYHAKRGRWQNWTRGREQPQQPPKEAPHEPGPDPTGQRSRAGSR